MKQATRSTLHLVLPVYSPEDGDIEDARYELCLAKESVQALNPNVIPLRCYGKRDLLLNKGISVRYQLRNKLNVGYDDIVMLIDGTGKIDFSAIPDFIKKFSADQEVGFLFAQRPWEHETWGMTEERKEIELFENFLIQSKLSVMNRIPEKSNHLFYANGKYKHFRDLQCGCWAFRGKHFAAVVEKLTAFHYELEVDVFIAAFEVFAHLKADGKRIDSSFISYVPVTLTGKAVKESRENCKSQMRNLAEAIDEHGAAVGDVDIARCIEAVKLLLKGKQSNFEFRDNIAKLVSICTRLGIKEQEFAEASSTWRRHLANRRLAKTRELETYWELVRLFYS